MLHKISTSIFILLLAFTMNVNAAPLAPVNDLSFSGEELFQGVFFGTGRVASYIPAVKGINVATYTSDRTAIANSNKFQEELIGKIKASNKGFFSTFKEMMTSRNHVQVQAALEMGAAEIQNVLQSDSEYQKMANNPEFQGIYKELSDKLNTTANAKEANATVTDYIADLPSMNADQSSRLLCVAAAIAVAAAVWIVVWKWTWLWSGEEALHSELLKEQIVESVVKLP